MPSRKYLMSFTTGGLFISESSMCVDLYLEIKDWGKVRKKVMDENLLQTRTIRSSKLICSMICPRLKTLSLNELTSFARATEQEKGYLLWVATCRTYLFIREFAVEVLREKFINLRPEITYEDFDIFFNARAEWNEGLERLTQATRLKLRQVLFRMMKEAQLVTDRLQILPAVIGPRLATLISEQDRWDLYVFPAMESEMKGWIR